jgi:hypothetical protein
MPFRRGESSVHRTLDERVGRQPRSLCGGCQL